MAEIAATAASDEVDPKTLRTVVAASSAGTTFEWYDFFVFGSLTGVISKTFFTGLPETAALAAALALFGTGFLFRPLGALVFGRIGDRAGRKGAFLATVLLMGGATVAIGLLPSYTQAGAIGPILLILMRIIQGFALGGEYGGAAIYVAEHARSNGRGQATSWIQTSAAFGLFGALIVILITRTAIGNEAFDAWGWRIPFLFSGVLLVVSIWMRLKLTESPEFAKLKAEGNESKAPFAEAFGQWPNLQLVLIALVAVMFAQGAVWYTAFFYAQTFMERFLKVSPETINLLMLSIDGGQRRALRLLRLALRPHRPQDGDAVRHGPDAGRLLPRLPPAVADPEPGAGRGRGDDAGGGDRRPGRLLAAVRSGGQGQVPVFLRHRQVDPVQRRRLLPQRARRGGPAGAGSRGQPGPSRPLTPAASRAPVAKAVKTSVETRIKTALAQAGYPDKADPKRMNLPGAFGVLLVFVIAATALYGPIAACLVELFPTRVRYTALSLPYHIGTGWVGGFVPFTAFAIVTTVGDLYSGLWYPFAFTAISVVTCVLLLPETKGRRLDG